MISMRLRRVYRRLSYLTGRDRDSRPGMQGLIPFCCRASLNQSASYPLRLGQIIEQGSCAGIIAYLTGGYEEAERSTIRIGESMQLRVHAALGAPD